ncbi:MAG: DUF433 domain-containing protein [Planctomycetes bacterium]|nr:DUF433 domain-containing protein [Planctomycetota bacterium]
MYDRIISNPAILGGKPCIQGTRLSVEMIVELLATGATIDDLLRQYPQLDRAAVQQAMQYAARFLRNEVNITAEIDR